MLQGTSQASWSPWPEAIIMRKGTGWEEPARHSWEAGITEIRSCPDQVPILACAVSLDKPPISTLGLQEKYLAPSEQSVEQEAMQL